MKTMVNVYTNSLCSIARAENSGMFLCYSLFFLFSGYALLRDPHYNKGLAFTEKERDAHFLRGLLPPTYISQETQVWLTL